jgi:sortase A
VPIVTLPDYPVPTPVITVTPQPGEVGPDTSEITRIVIPVLMLDTVVKYVPYDGFTWAIKGLREEVAWMGDTSWPGLGGNTGLAGHITLSNGDDGPFRNLDQLEAGDQVVVYSENKKYTYQVRDKVVVNDSDFSVIEQTANPQLTMITCTNWDKLQRIFTQRLVVYSDLIKSEPLSQTSGDNSN